MCFGAVCNLQNELTYQTIFGFGAGMKRQTKNLYTSEDFIIDEIQEIVRQSIDHLKLFFHAPLHLLSFFLHFDANILGAGSKPGSHI